VGVTAVRLSHDLVDDKFRVTADVEPLNPELGGDGQAVDKFLVLYHIVSCMEVQLNYVEESTSPGPVEGERAIKIHALLLLGDRVWRLLSLGPLGHEIR
jgi:hypothetical protein